MKNYIKNFGQFQKLNEQAERDGSSMAKAAISIFKSELTERDDNASWLLEDSKELASILQSAYGSLNDISVFHEQGFIIENSGEGMMIKGYNETSDNKMPIKSAEDTVVKYNHRRMSGDTGDVSDYNVETIVFDDESKLVQIWLGEDSFSGDDVRTHPYLIIPGGY
jgi:hypothetical protein